MAPRRWRLGVATLGAIAIVGLGVRYYPRRAAALRAKDTIVLADFANKTGDPVFDETMRQGLEVQLEQSPFLNIVSDRKIEETLRLMGQPTQPITPERARAICIRTGSKATVLGSISNLGSQYVIWMNAVGCVNGDTLATEQGEAAGKQDVLKTLGKAAAERIGQLAFDTVEVWGFESPRAYHLLNRRSLVCVVICLATRDSVRRKPLPRRRCRECSDRLASRFTPYVRISSQHLLWLT
jgi:hypothetical protein